MASDAYALPAGLTAPSRRDAILLEWSQALELIRGIGTGDAEFAVKGVPAFATLRRACWHMAEMPELLDAERACATGMINFLIDVTRKHDILLDQVCEVLSLLMVSVVWCRELEASPMVSDRLVNELSEEAQIAFGLQHQSIMSQVSAAAQSKVNDAYGFGNAAGAVAQGRRVAAQVKLLREALVKPSESIAPRALKLAIFDFDRTLAAEHLFEMLTRRNIEVRDLTEEELHWVFGGELRLQTLHTFLQQLWKGGVDLGIVSHGFACNIQSVLKRVNLDSFFKWIYGRDSDELKEVDMQKVRLVRRMRDARGLGLDQVIFCDDDAKNIEQEVLLGNGTRVTASQVCHTLGPTQGLKAGLTKEHMNKVLALAGQHLLSASIQ